MKTKPQLNAWVNKNSHHFPPGLKTKLEKAPDLFSFWLKIDETWHVRSVSLKGDWRLIAHELDNALNEIIILAWRRSNGNAVSFAA